SWITIVVILLLVIAYFGVGAVAANKLTIPKRRFPTEKSPATFDLVYEDVRFPARGGDADIAAWYIPNQGSHQAVIIVHGNNESRTYEFSGNMVDLGAALQQAGFNILMIDLRGHGQSGDGRASFGINERRDILGAVDWLLDKGYQPGSIGVLGTSLGGASSIGAGM
ncbi:alpha/beta hydrolase, partial [Chloroflexota bacterium]